LPPSGGRFKWLIAKGKEPLILYTLLLWRRVNLEQLKAPPEVEVDSHPLWGWESKEASPAEGNSPPRFKSLF